MNTAPDTEEMLTRRYGTLLNSLIKFNAGTSETRDVLNAVFNYCRNCYVNNADPVARLNDEQKTDLAHNLLPALPKMDSRLASLLKSFGGETLDNGRFVRSGQQYLQEVFLPNLNMSTEEKEEFQRGLDQLTNCDSWEEMVEIIDGWVEDEPLKNLGDPPLDLRGIPETHTWYSEHERAESKRTYHH